eukprot:Skav210266  [mRNA]  locus=scaffold1993:181752:185311:+ [translate_table: standard]
MLQEFHTLWKGQQWFSSHANSLRDPQRGENLTVRYRAFGKLIALALANHCKLAFANRERTANLDDLKGFDNALHSSLRKTLKMKAAQFKQIKELWEPWAGWGSPGEELEGLSPEMSIEHYVADQLKAILCPEALEEVGRPGHPKELHQLTHFEDQQLDISSLGADHT